MTHQPLDKHVKEFYDAQQLREEKLQQLLQLTETLSATSKQAEQRQSDPLANKSSHGSLQRWAAIAATVVILSVPLSTLWQTDDPKQLTQRIAQEVALNHNKQLAIEFPVKTYRKLQAQMVKLDFSLLPAEKLKDTTLRIIGGRYCSIQGQLAAQIKLIDTNGELYTLYQTELSKQLKSLTEENNKVNGVTINQWQEGLQFFALAKTTNQP